MPDVTVAYILEEDGLALKCNHSPLKFLICTHMKLRNLYVSEFNSQACRYEREDRDGNRKCLANCEVTIFLNVKNITIMANNNDNDADGNASGNSNGHGDNKDNGDVFGNDGDNHGEGEDEHEA